jgi:hypothetical protein
MIDATAIASLASSVQTLVERLAPIIATSTTTSSSSSRERGTTTSRGRVEGGFIDIDTLFPYTVPEVIDLTHAPPTPQKGNAAKKGVDLKDWKVSMWGWGHNLALYKLARGPTENSCH